MALHANPVAEDRPTGERAGRIDGKHADGASGPAQFGGEPIDEGALASAGRTGHADHVGVAGMTEDRLDQLSAARVFVFDQRNRAGDGARVGRQHALGQMDWSSADHRARSWRAMTRRWISLVPSPMVTSLTSRKNFSAG
jgi:hypothetical protein